MIILQEFKKISWNILEKLESTFEEILCKNRAGKMWRNFNSLLSKLLRKFWGNLEEILKDFDEIFSLKKTRNSLKEKNIA